MKWFKYLLLIVCFYSHIYGREHATHVLLKTRSKRKVSMKELNNRYFFLKKLC